MFPLRCLDLLWATQRATCWPSPHLLPCQSLPKILLFQLLGLSIATLSTVTHYGLHFTLISNISLENNSYRVIHHAAFYFGICLSMTLILAALLSSAATVRESPCLTAVVRMGRDRPGGAFCDLGLVPFKCGAGGGWFALFLLSSQVEDSMMDVYDLVYEEVRRNTSSFRRHELTAIHEAVSCLSALAENLDCLQEIQDFLKKHMDFVSTILGVYGMILTSFLWFSIHFSNNLDRKGKYILRESSWCRRMSAVTHKIPREGVEWGRRWDACLVFPLPALRAVVRFQAGQSGRCSAEERSHTFTKNGQGLRHAPGLGRADRLAGGHVGCSSAGRPQTEPYGKNREKSPAKIKSQH
uniref:Tetraspanin 32 n=1 Tax=Strix occidentalis caurina TaxID=311401 RepID=A0A8D0ELS0_STROC